MACSLAALKWLQSQPVITESDLLFLTAVSEVVPNTATLTEDPCVPGKSTACIPPGLTAHSTLEALSYLKAQLGCKWVIFSCGVHGLVQPQCLGVWRVLVKDGAASPVSYRCQQPSSPTLTHRLGESTQCLGEALRWKEVGAILYSHHGSQQVSIQGSLVGGDHRPRAATLRNSAVIAMK